MTSAGVDITISTWGSKPGAEVVWEKRCERRNSRVAAACCDSWSHAVKLAHKTVGETAVVNGINGKVVLVVNGWVINAVLVMTLRVQVPSTQGLALFLNRIKPRTPRRPSAWRDEGLNAVANDLCKIAKTRLLEVQ